MKRLSTNRSAALLLVVAAVAFVAFGCDQKSVDPIDTKTAEQSNTLKPLDIQSGEDIPQEYFDAQAAMSDGELDSIIEASVPRNQTFNQATSIGSVLYVWYPFGPAQVDMWSGCTGDRTNGGTLFLCGSNRGTHTGSDYYARDMSRYDGQTAGQKVYSGYCGTVVRAGWVDGYGNAVVIWDRNRSVATRYAHLQSIDPSIYLGQYICQGKVIGRVGNTPGGFSAHLHLASYEHVPVDRNGLAIVPYVCMSDYYACISRFFIN